MKKECLICKKEFVASKYKPNAKYCGFLCRQKGNSISSNKKRGDAQRGSGEGKSYTKLYGRHMHRVVAEQKISRKLKKGEVVHHINGNKLDNSPENLAVMTQSQHAKIHSTKNRKCSLEWCKNKHLVKGFCNRHYHQIKRFGKIIIYKKDLIYVKNNYDERSPGIFENNYLKANAGKRPKFSQS